MHGALETLLNQVLTGHPRGREQLAALHGTVVRLRGESPLWALYVLIYEDGLELLGDYEGPVDVRVRGSLGAMLHWLLVPNSADDDQQLRITGPADTLQRLQRMVSEFSLWPLVRNWLDDHVRLRELMTLLRREDPAWLERLADLPDRVGAIAAEVARQQLLQEDILEELRGLRQELRRARRLDLGFTLGGVLLVMLALLRALGQWQHTWHSLASDTLSLAMIGLGLLLILARLLYRPR
ncbi:SCP2 sterol-binding domain-containing protein [Alloalcanivorax mobilis]|uniref:SCP2 sterol-binding domain-containing protein n=1 Tax=Alloalcanivorax mobilis TaxID=2019569 RepID=UPI001E426AB6|nr:SCP2 sterol-binding domain-containing protein [Alloalcanivorax mobilis]